MGAFYKHPLGNQLSSLFFYISEYQPELFHQITIENIKQFGEHHMHVIGFGNYARYLSDEQIKALSPEQIGILFDSISIFGEHDQSTGKRIEVVSPNQIQLLSMDQLNHTFYLSSKQTEVLSLEQLSLLERPFSLLSEEATRSFSCTQIQVLTPEQIASITDKDPLYRINRNPLYDLMYFFHIEQIPCFLPEQLKAIPLSQIQKIPPNYIRALSDQQLTSLSTQQIWELSDQQLYWLTWDQLRLLDFSGRFYESLEAKARPETYLVGKDFKWFYFNSFRIPLFYPKHLKHLTADQLKNWIPDFIMTTFTPEQIKAMPHYLNSLSRKHFIYDPNPQLYSHFDYQIDLLRTRAIPPEQIAKGSDESISLFDQYSDPNTGIKLNLYFTKDQLAVLNDEHLMWYLRRAAEENTCKFIRTKVCDPVLSTLKEISVDTAKRMLKVIDRIDYYLDGEHDKLQKEHLIKILKDRIES